MRTSRFNTIHKKESLNLQKLLRYGRTIKLNNEFIEQYFTINSAEELFNKLEQEGLIKKAYDLNGLQYWENTIKGDYLAMSAVPVPNEIQTSLDDIHFIRSIHN